MSNPFRSAGVRELEIVTLYTAVCGGSEMEAQMHHIHVFIIHHSTGILKYNTYVRMYMYIPTYILG